MCSLQHVLLSDVDAQNHSLCFNDFSALTFIFSMVLHILYCRLAFGGA